MVSARLKNTSTLVKTSTETETGTDNYVATIAGQRCNFLSPEFGTQCQTKVPLLLDVTETDKADFCGGCYSNGISNMV